MDLDPDPVQLHVDRELAAAGLGQRGLEVGSAGREHREHRPADLEPEPGQRLLAAGERRDRDGGGRPGQHRGAAYGGQRHGCCRRDRLLDQGVEGSLADRAGDGSPEPGLLVGGRPTEQLGHRGRTRGLGARAGVGGDRVERLVHLEHGQGGGVGGLRRLAQPAPAQAGAALAQTAGEVGRDRLDLVGLGLRERLGQRSDLGLAGTGGGDSLGGGDDVGEQHGPILLGPADK